MDTTIEHHPDIAQILQAPAGYDGEFFKNCLGVKTRIAYWEDTKELWWFNGPVTCATFCVPDFNEEYFEWIDVIQAVKQAKNQFTMIELGAGHGRWSVYAALALRRLNPMPFKLIAVEPEPTHYEWLHQHFSDNLINPKDHILLKNAVAAEPKLVRFHVGNPSGWYGQAIDSNSPPLKIGDRIKYFFSRLFNKPLKKYQAQETGTQVVKSITLNSILAMTDHVDLLDLDIQGEEYHVLNASIDALNQKVKRIHIGTHSAEIDINLRLLFNQHQWKNINDYPCMTESDTPYGRFKFNDGVQTWVNPQLR